MGPLSDDHGTHNATWRNRTGVEEMEWSRRWKIKSVMVEEILDDAPEVNERQRAPFLARLLFGKSIVQKGAKA